ncbi:MAG: 4Fe-4S dicluster domain-containing protein [Deltaproteobacteria bacterium]|jgi:tetrathionate reductase subunit B|nr:4Fe-4S dicluster domain-containing protein [Deltaproteobacteria bacterium]MBT4067459.1 4Fe-4S dicluster domain-containing protein [Candidatus Neomarinimicrobiota bacterium]MBT5176843.1 4Fe-4S dicluster domain-containing protein [Candidatus Neomarinimicrobiota bacterium]
MAKKKKYAMVIDINRCIGCKACMTSCKAENDVPLGVFRNHVRELEKGIYPNMKKIFLPVLCNHCDKPACKAALPEGYEDAITKRDDGIVVWDEAKCKGKVAEAAIEGCPYSNAFMHPQKNVFQKCDYCVHRVDAGLQPACVSTCIGGARIFGDVNDSTSDVFKYMATHSTHVLKPEEGTTPNTYYVALDRITAERLEGSQQLPPTDATEIAVENFSG